MNSHAARSSASIPSSHLGLRWGFEGAPDEVAHLVRRCEIHDSIEPRNPQWGIRRHFTPGDTTAVLTGWDSSGTVRAAATVRWEPGERPDTAALRAHIDPRWRGRGIGRAVLAWQDALAIDVLAGATERRIGITIPSHLVDRRRLYAAAGFSSYGRIQGYAVALDSLRERPQPRDIQIVRLADLLSDSMLRAPRSAVSFISTGLFVDELLDSADPVTSHVALRDGEIVGAAFAHSTEDATGTRVGFIHDVLDSGDANPALLAATLQALRDSGYRSVHIRLSPESLASWEQAVLDSGGTPDGAYVVYSIEWP
ncbi:MAG: GNAT family N-acetyltransferase [Ruaniaceae bacterium]|nr:GNAT family N-acetyltransferase [Ruaniaceae bacterium]